MWIPRNQWGDLGPTDWWMSGRSAAEEVPGKDGNHWTEITNWYHTWTRACQCTVYPELWNSWVLSTPGPRQNGPRSMARYRDKILKQLRIVLSKSRDWRKEPQTYLLTYHTTPNATTGASPAKLLFWAWTVHKAASSGCCTGWPCCCIGWPGSPWPWCWGKGSAKLYVDHKRRAEPSDMRPGDKVIKVEHHKLETPFHPEPYHVVARNSSQVTIQSPAGVWYK